MAKWFVGNNRGKLYDEAGSMTKPLQTLAR